MSHLMLIIEQLYRGFWRKKALTTYAGKGAFLYSEARADVIKVYAKSVIVASLNERRV